MNGRVNRSGRVGCGCVELPVMMDPKTRAWATRRQVLAGMGSLGVFGGFGGYAKAQAAGVPAIDATFLFVCDVHACRMARGLSPNCQQEGKTDANLLRNIAALNGLGDKDWPAEIGGVATALRSAGKRIGTPLGLVVGGDMTDDGGGQVTQPSEGTQLLQFSQRYQQGMGPDRVHVPVYAGLGNHDLDQNGPPGRRRMSIGIDASCATISRSTTARACSSSRRCR